MLEYYDQLFCNPCNEYSIIIEDDGRVCYAYLLLGNTVVGDVWLYNQSDTPSEPEWNKKQEMPFLNSIEFVEIGNIMHPITSKGELEIKWIFIDKKCMLDQVQIFIRGNISAVIKQGSKPGWSINAKKDGPIAKTLVDERVVGYIISKE